MSETTTNNPAPVAPPPASGEQAPKRNRYEKKSGGLSPLRFIKTAIPLLLVGGLLFGAYKFISGNTKQASGEIIEATAYTGSLATYVTGWGSVSPVSKEDYGKNIKGEVVEVAVESGQLVSAGDLLFTIDPADMKAELLSARTELAGLERQLRDLDRNYANAIKRLADARESLAKCTVRAPFTGMLLNVSEALPRIGDTLGTGARLATLVDNSAMRLELWFNRAYISDIAVGQDVVVSVPDSMVQVIGQVSKINDQTRPVDGTACFGVEVKVPNNGGLAEDLPATGYIESAAGELRPSLDGKLTYWRSVDVLFEGVSAEIKSLALQEYGRVTEGQVLCTVDTRPASDAVSDAQYTVDDYVRQMSDDYIQNDIRKVEQKIENLQEIVDNSGFYATIDGQVTNVSIKPGDKLMGGDAAAVTISDTSSLIINVNIDEADISSVKLGTAVDLTYDTNDGSQMASGTVTYVSFEAKINTDGGSAYFPATITLESDGTLLPGMSVNYSILAVSRDMCMILPSQCIVNTEEGPVVFVKNDQDFGYEHVELGEGVVPDGYYAVRVEIGIADTENTEIVSGLEEGTVCYQATMQTDNSGYWY